MNGLEKKLREIESHIVGDMPEGESYLDVSEMPKAEQEMHMKAQELARTGNPETLSETDLEIIQKSIKFLQFRVFKLFLKSLMAVMPHEQYTVGARLLWFIEQSTIWLGQSRNEEEIFSNDSLSEQEREKLLRPVYDVWVDTFSDETWRKFLEESGMISTHFEASEKQDAIPIYPVNTELAKRENPTE